MKRLALVLLLAACSSERPVIPASSYRDASVPIASKAVFDAARYQGRWYEIASFPAPSRQGCTDTQVRYGPAPEGLSVTDTCLRNGTLETVAGTARLTGPGRMEVQLDGAPSPEPYWVLWVDEGYRTAVVGVPSGRAGWILNRDPTIPPDRLAAAREILDFNGYDLTQLRMTPQGGA